MKRLSTLMLLVVVPLAASTAMAKARWVTDPDIPRSLPDDAPVAVQWDDPAKFSELRHSHNNWEARRGDWVRQLAEHLQEEAAERLPPGERLEVTINDIKRAGSFEPWHGINMQDVRIMRDIYPPSIELTFKRYGADGQVLAEGTRKLRDMSYLTNASIANSNDSLRYEKRMIDDWLRKELRPEAPVASR